MSGRVLRSGQVSAEERSESTVTKFGRCWVAACRVLPSEPEGRKLHFPVESESDLCKLASQEGAWSRVHDTTLIRWEREHDIDTNDTPEVPEGKVHCSDVNISTMKSMVEEYQKDGDVLPFKGANIYEARPGENLVPNPFPSARLQRDLIDAQNRAEKWQDKDRKQCALPTCGKVHIDLRQCSGCKQVWYCDKGCQVAHWKGHKKACKQMQNQ
mmetsp:Transcript_12977/g.20390  ORF Transcript_12977/g.20390 Transcript_12977/m.20390 type:complete len:213 (+) Transcript_12977:508-1146(+)